MKNILIIGGGAAGMMAAISAADTGLNNVTLIEKNEKLGKKLFITGKGRCNVTNACETQELFNNVMEHSKFLYSAIYGFDNYAVMDFFEKADCPLKIERGQRVFPVSDHSSDIIRVLENEIRRLNVKLMFNCEVKKINTVILEDSEEDESARQEEATKKKKVQKKLKHIKLNNPIVSNTFFKISPI